jgi:hypothetical protein
MITAVRPSIVSSARSLGGMFETCEFVADNFRFVSGSVLPAFQASASLTSNEREVFQNADHFFLMRAEQANV